jgi:uncharacterized protein (DUF1330 family)
MARRPRRKFAVCGAGSNRIMLHGQGAVRRSARCNGVAAIRFAAAPRTVPPLSGRARARNEGTVMHVTNALYPTGAAQMQAMQEAGPPGPIVMVNLLKFKDRAVYEDGRPCDLSGRDAYALYGRAVAGLIQGVGGRILFAGAVSFLAIGEAEPLWDQIALAEYPDRRAIVTMAMSPAYQAIAVHRTAGLAGQLNIETVPHFNLADMVAKSAGS